MRILVPILLGLLIALAIGYTAHNFMIGGVIGLGVGVAIGVTMARRTPPPNPSF